MKTLLKLIILCLSLHTFAQVGIGNVDPKATLHVTGEPNNPSKQDGVMPPSITRAELTNKTAYGTNQIGTLIYVSQVNGTTNSQTSSITKVGIHYFDGVKWESVNSNIIGDIKTGAQTADHNGWILLNGRSVNSLTSTQKAQAISMGFNAAIPNATNAALMQSGAALGTITGNTAVSILQPNLPNINFTGTTSVDGIHNHRLDNSNPANNGRGQRGLIKISDGGANTHTTSGLGLRFTLPDVITRPIKLEIEEDGEHTHTISTANSGGNGAPVSIIPRVMKVNTFIFLGL